MRGFHWQVAVACPGLAGWTAGLQPMCSRAGFNSYMHMGISNGRAGDLQGTVRAEAGQLKQFRQTTACAR